jgi:hypothetical protein
LPAILFGNAALDIEVKDDGDVNNVTNTTDVRRLAMRVDWALLANRLGGSRSDETLDRIEHYLLARPTSGATRKVIRGFTHRATDDGDFIRRAFIAFMSLPEYQLS